jgi:hypothetical protein
MLSFDSLAVADCWLTLNPISGVNMNKPILVFALMVLMAAPYKSAFPQAVQDAAKSTENGAKKAADATKDTAAKAADTTKEETTKGAKKAKKGAKKLGKTTENAGEKTKDAVTK